MNRMEIGSYRRIAFAVALYLLVGAAPGTAQTTKDEIDYLCDKKRELIETEYRSKLSESGFYSRDHSLAHFKEDPQVIEEAKEATRAQARREQWNWPRKTQGWGPFKTPAPMRQDPWNDPRFDYEKHYEVFLNEIARRRAAPYSENSQLKLQELEQQYEEQLRRLDEECSRGHDLFEKRQQELAAQKQKDEEQRRQLEKEEKARRKMDDLIEEERQKQEILDRLTNEETQRFPSLDAFLDGIEPEPRKSSGVLFKPGRFDAVRKPGTGRLSTPVAPSPDCPDSLASVLDLLLDSARPVEKGAER